MSARHHMAQNHFIENRKPDIILCALPWCICKDLQLLIVTAIPYNWHMPLQNNGLSKMPTIKAVLIALIS